MSLQASLINRPAWQRLFLAVTSVVAALGLTELLWMVVDRPITSPLFLAAIVFSAWFCGWEMGLVSALLSAVAIDFFFIDPFYELSFGVDDIARLVLFMAESGIVCWLVDLRLKATREMEQTQSELRALTAHQQTLREAEQKRIALEIHDELGQALTGLKMEVHVLGRIAERHASMMPTDVVHEKLGHFTGQIDDTIRTVRRIATELRPSLLDDFGLVAAIEWETKEFARRSGIHCEFRSDFASLELTPDESTATFRIVQEALTNIARHAKAANVDIVISPVATGTNVTVTDDGVGFAQEKMADFRSLGILGMKERAKLIDASLDVSTSGRGTSVSITLPRNRAAARL